MLKLFIAFFITCFALIYLNSIPGQVNIDFNGVNYQFSFFLIGVLLLVSFAALILFLIVFNFILDLPKTIKNIFTQRQYKLSRADLQKSFSTLMLGNFKQSEKTALKRIYYSKTPGLHLIIAAFSAHKLGNIELAMRYLNQSTYFLKDENDIFAFESFKAALKIDGGFLTDAEVILEDLTNKLPKNTFLLDNLSKIYLKQKKYDKAYHLLGKIKKLKVYSEQEYQILESKITAHKLEAVMYSENLVRYTEFWNTLSRHQKNDVMIKLQYFLGLIYLDGFIGKDNLFNRFVITNFSNEQVWNFLYAHPQLASKINRPKIKSLVAKQKPSITNVVLAKSYLDADMIREATEIAGNCVQIWQEIPVWKIMAEIYETKGDTERALECYRIINQKELSLHSKQNFNNSNENENPVSLTWMSDEKISEDGETKTSLLTQK